MRFVIYLFIIQLFTAEVLFSQDSLTIPVKNDNHCTNVSYGTISIKAEKVISFSEQPYTIELEVVDSSGVAISDFSLEISDSETKGLQIYPKKIKTDTLGYAKILISDFKPDNKYNLLIFSNYIFNIAKPVSFEFSVRRSNWIFMMLAGLFGGLSLFLLGMSMMSNGLQNSAGDKMHVILHKISDNRFVAMGVGALITTIIQSSSATNVMLVSFVNSQLMRFKQTIAIILGAAIGTTITAQIIAFKVTDYSLVFITVGLILHYVGKNAKLHETGRAILGFGILFFGMHIMSESMYPLRSYQPFINLIVSLEAPILGILAGILFTALIQSSSAFIGILIILSMQGLLSLDAAISLIIGANIGTAITAILASVKTTREAKQVALAHTLIKVFAAILFLFFIPLFTKVIHFFEPGESMLASPRQIANAHTIYNVVICAIFLPITNSFAWLIEKIYPVPNDINKALSLSYIDNSLLVAPSLALEAAKKETISMMREVENMASKILEPFLTRKAEVLNEICDSEKKVNYFRDRLSEFLIALSRNDLSESDIKMAFNLLNSIREFEQIADVISTQLKNKAESWCSSKYEFSETGKEELVRYHEMTLKIIRKAIKVYETYNLKKAYKLKEKYYSYREEFFKLEQQHYERLKLNIEETISSSKTHLEIITLLRVISSHATNTSRILIYSIDRMEEK